MKRVLIQGELYFAFDTISSAQEAADDVALIRGGEWLIEFITLRDFSLVSLNRPDCIDELEGQVILWAHGPFDVVQNEFLSIQQMLYDRAASYGKVLGRIPLASDIPNHWEQEVLGTGLLVEFDSLSDGKRFFNAHKDAVYDGVSNPFLLFLASSEAGASCLTGHSVYGLPPSFQAAHVHWFVMPRRVITMTLRNTPIIATIASISGGFKRVRMCAPR